MVFEDLLMTGFLMMHTMRLMVVPTKNNRPYLDLPRPNLPSSASHSCGIMHQTY